LASKDKINKAILRIQQGYEMSRHAGNTLICAYSGGKDSDALLDLCLKSGVPFRAEHNHTGIDAPETAYHIRDVFSGLNMPTAINMPEMSMWQLIVKKLMPPTRRVRYCCEYLKERKFDNQHLLMGVRWAESNSRKSRGTHEKLSAKREDRIIYQDENDNNRKLTEICMRNNRVATNPIIDWTDKDVWEYVRNNNLKMNPLYECGFRRVGCIGCPNAGKHVLAQFARYPKYKVAYIRAFDKMIIAKVKSRERRRKPQDVSEIWQSGEMLFNRWTNPKFDPQQLTLEDMEVL